MCETIEHVCIVQLIHGVLTVIPGKVWLGLRYSCCTNSHPGKVWLGLTYIRICVVVHPSVIASGIVYACHILFLVSCSCYLTMKLT